jgi:hypothetical protein
MKFKYFHKVLFFAFMFFSIGTFAASLTDDAKNRGISKTCHTYLNQIEESYGLNGLNITFAHPEESSIFPSLHVSAKKYNNGTSSFSATLTPEGENCFLSIVLVTSVNNQSCSEIAQIKTINENLTAAKYAEGSFIILTPSDNSYQIILTSSSDSSCTMTEARMMWPGR